MLLSDFIHVIEDANFLYVNKSLINSLKEEKSNIDFDCGYCDMYDCLQRKNAQSKRAVTAGNVSDR